MTDHADVVERFAAALARLRVDDEGCSPTDWPDVRVCAGLCRDMRIHLGDVPDGDLLLRLVDSTEDMLTTFVVVAPSNYEVVSLWRDTYDEYRDCRLGGLERT